MHPVMFTRDSIKTLRRMPASEAKRIRGRINRYTARPTAKTHNDVTALKGEANVRLRVGSWRVILHEAEVLAIIRSRPRGKSGD